MKTIALCRGCLRTDRNIRDSDEVLSALYHELCKYNIDALARFCSECAHMLRKFKDFRDKCHLATTTLHSWIEEDENVRIPLSTLSTKMPPPQLDLCNKTNFKMFTCHEFYPLASLEMASPEYPHIVSYNLDNVEEHLSETPKLEIIPSYEDDDTETNITIKHETDIDNISIEYQDLEVDISDISKTEQDFYTSDSHIEKADKENETDKTDDNLSDVNFTTEKVIQVKTELGKRKLVFETNDSVDDETRAIKKKRKSKKNMSLKELKRKLIKRFDKCGTLTDDEGNVIDTDVIINCLDRMSVITLKQLECQIAKGFSPRFIKHRTKKLLAYLQKKYSCNDSCYITKSHSNITAVSKNDGSQNVYTSNDDTSDIDENASSDDEIIAKIALKDVIKKGKILKQIGFESANNIKRHKYKSRTCRKTSSMKLSVEELRRELIKVFNTFGELINYEGTVIDTDMILNNLNKIPLKTLVQLQNEFTQESTAKAPTREGMRLLTIIHNRYRKEYSKGFTIEQLPTQELVAAEFAKMQYCEQYVKADHKCELCFKPFRTAKQLENHVQNLHNENNPFSCSLCNVRYNKESSLRCHTMKHKTVCKCKLCPYICNEKNSMIVHYNQHIKDYNYTCELCDGKFKSRSGYYFHVSAVHQQEKSFTCNNCGKQFSSEWGLKVHHSKAHQGQEMNKPIEAIVNEDKTLRKQRTLKCPVCKTVVQNVTLLKQHFEDDHPGESFKKHYSTVKQPKHICYTCGKAFRSVTGLNQHRNVHSGVRPYVCASCGATFARQASLHTHAETHLPRNKECKICGKQFSCERLLKYHMKYHNPPTLECVYCLKKFRTCSNLSNHMRGHIGERRYKCELCPKMFLDSSNRNAHVRGVHNHIRREKRKKAPES